MPFLPLQRSVARPGKAGKTSVSRLGFLGLAVPFLVAVPAVAQVNINQFALYPSLVPYSVYTTDSINLGNSGGGTADGGLFGSGGGIVLPQGVKVRNGLTSVRSVLIGMNTFDTGTFNVQGNLSFGGGQSVVGQVQVLGNLTSNSNGNTFAQAVYVADSLNATGDRNAFLSTVQTGGKISNNGGNTNTYGGTVTLGGTVAADWGGLVVPQPTIVPNVAFPSPPPLGYPLNLGDTALPGYKITGLTAAPTTTISFANFDGNVVNCPLTFGPSYCKGDTLIPGNYGNIDFGSYAQKRLLVGEGFYQFQSINFNNAGDSIVAAQPNGARTFIYATTNIVSSSVSNDFIGPAGAVGATGYGSGVGQFLGGTLMLMAGGNIHFGSDLYVWATMSAPHGDVIFDNQVHVFGRVKSSWGGSDEKVREIAANPPIEQTGNIVRIGIHHENLHNISIDYEIEAPANAYLDAGSGSGNVTDDGVGENAKLNTGSGSIHATGLHGSFTVNTGSGNIYAEQIGQGDVKANTGSGTIELKDVKGGLRAETGSGNIKIGGTPTAAWHLQTGSGSVELRAGDAPLTLDASTGSGSIHSEREMLTQGSNDRHHLTGKLNGGGPTVRVETGSGDIRVE